MRQSRQKGSNSSSKSLVSNTFIQSYDAGHFHKRDKGKQKSRALQSKGQLTPVRVTCSRTKSKRRSSPLETVVVDLEMDALEDNPGSEQQNLNDEETSQEEQETFQVDSIMVIRDEKDAGTDFGKTPVSTGPVWLDNMLGSKKRNIVPTSIPIEDMVSKCLGKTPKAKKSKTVSKIDFDVDIKKWVAEIAHPLIDAKIESPTVQDFTFEKVNIRTATHATDALHLEASTKKIITWTWKDERDKH